ncbi:MAG: S8 family peptidase [Bacteroidales bacterium]|jgi:hypothetical protein|nr:S8 family peptidase [Bacteroidales bacterium]
MTYNIFNIFFIKIKSGLFSKIIFCFIILSLFTFRIKAQDNNPYYDNIIILKIKEEYKNGFFSNKQISSYFSELNIKSLEKEFPNTITPVQKYNTYGQKLTDLTNIYRLETENNDIKPIINYLNKLESIEYAEPLYKIELLFVPDDPHAVSNQYWLEKIKAYDAWDIHKGDTNTVIGISDTGIDLSHPDLIYNIKYNYNDIPDGIDNDRDGYIDNFRGWNFGDNNNNPQATDNHGVQVCGIAGASVNNGEGVAGAGYLCKILPLKISNSSGTIVNAYQSIVYAAEHGCAVINCSWGNTYYQKMGQDVINYAVNNYDLLVVAACGNTNTETEYYPASYENVLSVAATTSNDEKWMPSNTGTTSGSSYSYNVDICAPGTIFFTTALNGTYSQIYGGTSYAAPIVSGCAGILRSYFPQYSALQIGELIKISADNIYGIEANIPYSGKLGAGRINLYNALTIEPTPSIVFRNISVDYREDKVIINGEFRNFLANAENLNITANINSIYTHIENNNIFSGNLNTNEAYLSDNEIIVYIRNNPENEKVSLELTYEADNYSTKQLYEFYLNKTYKNAETDLLTLSVTENGRLGYSDPSSTTGDGFIINYNDKLFNSCGIISGSGALQIYSSVGQVSDFKTSSIPGSIENEDFDFHIRYEFSDSSDIDPSGIKYIQDVYSKYGSDYKNFILIDYTLINKSGIDLENYYFGLFADWDLINGNINSSEYIESENFLYCKSDNAETLYAGIKLLSGHPVKNYVIPMVSGGDGLVDLTNGLLDIERFHIISNSSNTYPGDSTDVSQYTGVGPFNLKNGDTTVISFALIASYDYYNFINGLNKSKEVYKELHNNNENSIISYENNYVRIFPNPTNGSLTIEIEEGHKALYYEIINTAGITVLKSDFKKDIDVNSLPSGIYQLRIICRNKVLTEKFIKTDK